MRPEELAKASEVFLCGTAAEIVPVARSTGTTTSRARFARTLMARFPEAVRAPDSAGLRESTHLVPPAARLWRLDRRAALSLPDDDVRGVSGLAARSRAARQPRG